LWVGETLGREREKETEEVDKTARTRVRI
jgi:hypothetical protein